MVMNVRHVSIEASKHDAVIRLGPEGIDDVIEHLCALDHDDRQWRFGTPLADEAIVRYAGRMEFAHDAVLAVHDSGGMLVALAHVARLGDSAEVGLSVLAHRRRRGLGRDLLHRAAGWARRTGLREVWLQGHRENVGIRALAAGAGMRIEPHGSDVIARLPLTHAMVERAPDARRTSRWTTSSAAARDDVPGGRATTLSRVVEAGDGRRCLRTDARILAPGPRRAIARGR